MPRFSYEDADSYGGQSGAGSFFQLKDDGDTARVHLLGNDMNDFCGYAVHKVPVGDKDRYVNCLREAHESVDVCPFCASKDKDISKVYAKMFIPLYNVDAEEVQIWERGKSFFRPLSSYCSRNPKVVNVLTEVERLGKKGDTNTTYQLIKIENTDVKLEDFEGDIPEVIGTIVKDVTADDMQYYLDKGSFPDGESAPVRRESRREPVSTSSYGRRTPSNRRSAEEEY